MKITLTDAGKRFNRDWIFQHLSFSFLPGESYAITGPNGCGKSTLLQAIAGSLMLSTGKLQYESFITSSASETLANIPSESAYKHLSIAAPYLELIEEMTAVEFLNFHSQFKPLLPGADILFILESVGLKTAAHKQIRYYSSGMKQRLKLAQAFFSDVSSILLDEPCTNLDAQGIELYRKLVETYGKGRLLIVSSNDRQEYEFCRNQVSIMDYKP